jgi:hypothetical protein
MGRMPFGSTICGPVTPRTHATQLASFPRSGRHMRWIWRGRGVHGFHMTSSRKLEPVWVTNIARFGEGAGLYCAADVASVPVAAGGTIGELSLAGLNVPTSLELSGGIIVCRCTHHDVARRVEHLLGAWDDWRVVLWPSRSRPRAGSAFGSQAMGSLGVEGSGASRCGNASSAPTVS